MDGKGIETDKAIVYDGDWVRGKKNGFGRMVFDDESTYEGNFKDNLQNGEGILIEIEATY